MCWTEVPSHQILEDFSIQRMGEDQNIKNADTLLAMAQCLDLL